MAAKMVAEMTYKMADIVLPQMGAAPLAFAGALLVEGRSHHARGDRDVALAFHCWVRVYECAEGFVAQALLMPPGAPAQGLSFLKQAENPAALRQWLTTFDPAVGVDVTDVTTGLNGSADHTALANAAKTIAARLKHMRCAYASAAHNALGQHAHALAPQ